MSLLVQQVTEQTLEIYQPLKVMPLVYLARVEIVFAGDLEPKQVVTNAMDHVTIASTGNICIVGGGTQPVDHQSGMSKGKMVFRSDKIRYRIQVNKCYCSFINFVIN